MNQHLHRIIFNTARGEYMVVSEVATSHAGRTATDGAIRGAPAGVGAPGVVTVFLSTMAFGVLLACAPAHAQVRADPNAPGIQRPTILQTSNGVVQVNIQTPSVAGVSRNAYARFDVTNKGVILNNVRSNAAPTRLAGQVSANPWLATGSARVILNEVNSANPSLLNGYVEVAGQRAEVVIANPAGIRVNGGGFINAAGVTLTTGSPLMNGAALEAFRITRGMAIIEGLGLDVSTADYARILARAMQVNAGLWAQNLTVATGSNDVKALAAGAEATTTPIAGTGAAPGYMLDVAAIGGMYAGHIYLKGTEAGLGVNNQGSLVAQDGQLTLLSDGRLVNQGHMKAKGDLRIQVTGNIHSAGTQAFIGSQASTTLMSGAAIGNTQAATIAATGGMTLTATDALSNTQGGQIASGSNLGVVAAVLDNQGGSVLALGHVNLAANTVTNNQGEIAANGDATLTVGVGLDNTAGVLSAGRHLVLQDTAPAPVLAITQTGGTALAGGDLRIQSASLTGDGTLQAVGNLAIDVRSDFESTTDIVAGGDAGLTTGGTFTNRARFSAWRGLSVHAADIDNTATGQIAGSATTLSATNLLTNRGLIDGAQTRIDTGSITNIGTGRIYGDHLAVAAHTFTNDTEALAGVRADAVIAARKRLEMGVGTLDNREHALIFSAGTGTDALRIGGALDAQGHAIGMAQLVSNRSATIESLGGLAIAAQALNNTNGHFTTDLEPIDGPTRLKYIQPSGSATKVRASNFVWEGWSRAGQYRYRTNPPVNSSGVLGVSPVPRVGEQHCTGDEPDEACTRLPGADYLADNPAWTYFGLTPPQVEPAAPTLAEPAPPPESEAASCESGPGYNAATCTAYGNALAQYQTQKATYDKARSSYTSDHTVWQADAAAKYEALDKRIETYNADFAASLVRSWTAFSVTRSERQSRVKTSDPGQMLSGGAMRLSGGDLVNDKSRIIAGGTLSGDLANLRHIEAVGQHVVQEAGTSVSTWPDWKGGFKRYHKRAWGPVVGYHPADVVTTIVLPVAERRDNTQHAGTGAQVAAHTLMGTVSRPQSAPADHLPTGSLFQQNPSVSASYVVETDPRFTSYRQWLGSDYMLNALSQDPTTTQKRLGDGFYEQRLIREQVAQLTGQHFLGDHTNDEAQYVALMDSGLIVARQWNLVPGIALSAEQVARLTSDIVWLVAREVALADGSRQTVLVPQLYLRPRAGDLSPTGALLAGQNLELKLSGDLANAGTVAGRDVVRINASNLNNLGGQIAARVVNATASQDIRNVGGQMTAQDRLDVQAGRDVHTQSTTQSDANTVGASSFSRTVIDRVAGLYVTGEAATLVASAGRDVTLMAGVITNTGHGDTTLTAGRDIRLQTITTNEQENSVHDARNYLVGGHTQEVGSQITGASNVTLAAGGDVSARAATVNAQQALAVRAGGGVVIEAGEVTSHHGMGYQRKSNGFLSKKTATASQSEASTTAIGSEFDGQTVTLRAGGDAQVRGSSVIADRSTTVVAGGALDIQAAQTTHSSRSHSQTNKSGLGAMGGISYGQSAKRTNRQTQGTSTAASTVGAIGGDVTLIAGQSYRQTGSDVAAPSGDVNILAQDTTFAETRETQASRTEEKQKSSGISVGVSAPVISTVQGIASTAQAMGDTKNARTKALGASTLALQGQQALDSLQNIASATNSAQAAGVSVSIGIGTSKSHSVRETQASRSRGSGVVAGGDVNLIARGADAASDILVRGSNLTASGVARLIAEGDITLQAARNDSREHSRQSSKSASVGIGFSTGGSQSGININASASKSQGQVDSFETTHSHTHVNAGKRVVIDSGGDTTVKGATAQAEQIVAKVGGNLDIESSQDTDTYDERSQNSSAGVSLCLPPLCHGASSVSVGAAKTTIDSDYHSANEQSGLRAGDGGFLVSVAGHTDLKGGAITSTERAVQEGKNRFDSGRLTVSDLQNAASYSGKSSDVTLGVGSQLEQSGAGVGSDKGRAQSTTQAAISDVAGKQDARTGDGETGLAPIFDKDQVKRDIEAQVTITAAFVQEARSAVKKYGEQQREKLKAQAEQATSAEERAGIEAQLKSLNQQDRVINLLISAVAGMGGSALAQEGLAAAADQMRQLMIEDSKKFAGVVDSSGKTLDNILGQSVGVGGDGYKLGGTRVDLDALCGAANRRCKKNADGSLALNERGQVVLTGGSLEDFLKTPDGIKMIGPTGGIQGMKGSLFGVPYAAGDWQDKLIEAFAGPHDYIGGGLSGLYDEQGNARRGRDEATRLLHEAWSVATIPAASPFAAAKVIPRDVWLAISILLKAAR